MVRPAGVAPHRVPRLLTLLRKIAVILEELGLTYETKYLDFQKGEQTDPEYIKINPNCKIPAIIDHYNDDFTLWCAIFPKHDYPH